MHEDIDLQLEEMTRQYLEQSMHAGDEQLFAQIEAFALQVYSGRQMDALEISRRIKRVFHSIRGLDVLQPLLDDAAVTEIMINSHQEIFIERHGKVYQHPESFSSQEKLEDIIQRIVGKVNRAVNEASPVVDARLPDGSRVNVVLPPIALKGPAMTIRKFPEEPIQAADLVAWGTLTAETAEFLEQLVKAKYNIFISGGTGSGKTTLLNVLSNFIPADERMITIEDSAELQIRHLPNLVQLETRNANTEGKGEITIRDLIKSSLRMRPNRIVVGEVRGAEALDMLMAMNTGHDGSLSTGHANSARDMLSRLETMVLSGTALPIAAIRQQIDSAIDIIIHLSRLRDYSRKIVEISEISGFENGELLLNPLYRFVEEEPHERRVVGRLTATGNRMLRTDKFQMAGMGESGVLKHAHAEAI